MAACVSFIHPASSDVWKRGSTQILDFQNDCGPTTTNIILNNSSLAFVANIAVGYSLASGESQYSWIIPNDPALIPDGTYSIHILDRDSDLFTISGTAYNEKIRTGSIEGGTTLDFVASEAPSALPGVGRFYFDNTTKKMQLSDNGGAFHDLNASSETPAEQRFALSAAKKSNAGSYDVTGWAAQSAAAANSWTSICWSPDLGLFVAVSSDGGTNQVMTSTNGQDWTLQTTPIVSPGAWESVCWASGIGLFLAVDIGTPHVMTSPNGVTWTSRTAGTNTWTSVCWSQELTLAVAVANDSGGATPTGRVMTSANGTTWTGRTAAEDNTWTSVCWSPELGLFCAVSSSGTHRVMTSSDGINWVSQTAAEANSWQSICWSPELGLFVAVATTGTHEVMTSADGVVWTSQTAAAAQSWDSICWSPELGLLVALSLDGAMMTSANAINWTTRTIPEANAWTSICWAPEIDLFVAVASGGAHRVMTSRNFEPDAHSLSNGSFVAQGDAQAQRYVVRNMTTDATPTNLFLDGVGTALKLPATFSTLTFKVNIVGQSVPTTGVYSASLEGGIWRTSTPGSTSLIDTAVKTMELKGSNSWSSDVIADTTNDAVAVQVTGEVGKTIQWVAEIETVVTFAAS